LKVEVLLIDLNQDLSDPEIYNGIVPPFSFFGIVRDHDLFYAAIDI